MNSSHWRQIIDNLFCTFVELAEKHLQAITLESKRNKIAIAFLLFYLWL